MDVCKYLLPSARILTGNRREFMAKKTIQDIWHFLSFQMLRTVIFPFGFGGELFLATTEIEQTLQPQSIGRG
jgi:hypothetical protein